MCYYNAKGTKKCVFLKWHNMKFALFMAAQNREQENKGFKLIRQVDKMTR